MTATNALQNNGMAYPQLPPIPQQLPKTQADWQAFVNVLQNWQAAMQLQPSFQSAIAVAGTPPNQVFVGPATLYQQSGVMLGLKAYWEAPASATYLKIATLPASSVATLDSLNIRATLNTSWAAAGSTLLDIVLGNRNGFSYLWNRYGPPQADVAIVAYAESDGSTSVYAVGEAGDYTYANISILNAGDGAATDLQLYPVPAETTAPTGTLVFSTANEPTYPPETSSSSGSVSAAVTGLTGVTSATLIYSVKYPQATVYMPSLSGVSDATTFSVAIPADLQPARAQTVAVPAGLAFDNGASITDCNLDVTTTQFDFVHNNSPSGWTASGNKGFSAPITFSYLLN